MDGERAFLIRFYYELLAKVPCIVCTVVSMWEKRLRRTVHLK